MLYCLYTVQYMFILNGKRTEDHPLFAVADVGATPYPPLANTAIVATSLPSIFLLYVYSR
jgi:hypothetical protein